MAQRRESERGGRRRIGMAEAVDRRRREQAFLAAVDRRELALGEITMAVVHGVAAGVRRDQQGIVPGGVEQRRQRMRFVMIVEPDERVGAKAAVATELRHVDDCVDVGGVVADELRRHVAPGTFLDVAAVKLAQPAHAPDGLVITGIQFAAAEEGDVHVAAGGADDRQDFVDARIRMNAAVALAARQPLELHGRLRRIVEKHCGRGIVYAGMNGKNELRHRSLGRTVCADGRFYVNRGRRATGTPLATSRGETSFAPAMRTDLFDFDLPPDRIALRPASPRDAARLLVVRPGATAELADRTVRDLPDLLRPGDALVVNDTKVIPARLQGRRIGRGTLEPAIEATLHRRLDGSRWRSFVKPAKRLSPGDVVRFGDEGKVCFLGQLDTTVEAKGEGGEVTLAFAFNGPVLDQAVDERGAMPLPPYIAARRPPDERDRVDYQTLFAQAEGSVAAPTAGLHFTETLTARLPERGVTLHKVTLHVGAGTFLPVKAADTSAHRMQGEQGVVSAATADALNAARRA